MGGRVCWGGFVFMLSCSVIFINDDGEREFGDCRGWLLVGVIIFLKDREVG